MDKKKFLETYFNNLKQLINFEGETISKIIQTCDLLLDSKKNGKKNLMIRQNNNTTFYSTSFVLKNERI